VVVAAVQDLMGGAQDAGTGGAQRGVDVTGLRGPAGDVGEGVLGGVQAMIGGHQVGQGFGLDLAVTAALLRHTLWKTLWTMHQDVAQFVGQGALI